MILLTNALSFIYTISGVSQYTLRPFFTYSCRLRLPDEDCNRQQGICTPTRHLFPLFECRVECVCPTFKYEFIYVFSVGFMRLIVVCYLHLLRVQLYVNLNFSFNFHEHYKTAVVILTCTLGTIWTNSLLMRKVED